MALIEAYRGLDRVSTTINNAFMVDKVWSASRVDEEWQIEQWGSDEEAMAVSEKKYNDFKIGCEFYQISL